MFGETVLGKLLRGDDSNEFVCTEVTSCLRRSPCRKSDLGRRRPAVWAASVLTLIPTLQRGQPQRPLYLPIKVRHATLSRFLRTDRSTHRTCAGKW